MQTLYDQFQDACKKICKEFSINPKNIKLRDRMETVGIGVDYIAEISNKDLELSFHIRTVSKKGDPADGEVKAFLYINYKDARPTYDDHEDLGYNVVRYSNLSHWAQCAAYRHNVKHVTVNLKNMFGDKTIRVYGYPHASEPANTEFIILISGISKRLAIVEEKLVVYRFRHLSKDSHFSYSYAFWAPENLWIFFPFAAGGGGGGGQDDFEYFEKHINKKRKYGTDRKYFDIDYSELEKFLLSKELNFRSSSVFGDNTPFPEISHILEENCKERFLNKHYSDAVFTATKILEREIIKISKTQKLFGVPLVNKVFDEKNPMIDISPGSEEENVKEREGFKLFLKGVFLGIKNIGSHSLPTLDEPLIASQYLTFIDLLISKIQYAAHRSNNN